MPSYERIGYGSPDGMQLAGSSSEAIAFYGSVPTTQISIGAGLSTATHASTLISTVAEALKTVGLFRT